MKKSIVCLLFIVGIYYVLQRKETSVNFTADGEELLT